MNSRVQKWGNCLLFLLVIACNISTTVVTSLPIQTTPQKAQANGDQPPAVPHLERWGIYRLSIDTQEVSLLYSSPIQISTLRLNRAGDRFVFSRKAGRKDNTAEEIFTLSIDGRELRRLTDNSSWDLYPAWSPDGSRIAFLTQRGSSLGIYVMNADGSLQSPLYDSSAHEADIDWVGDQIAFTKDSRIWIMQADGANIRSLTDPPRAGEWGAANLPFGDYDPRISPDGVRVIFERLVDDQSPHGNYDFFIVDIVSAKETRLTHSGYSQGLASWSHTGEQIIYIVAAIEDVGQYDIYLMDADGTSNRNITPGYFPPEFLCHWAIFSNPDSLRADDASIYFIGEWWSAE